MEDFIDVIGFRMKDFRDSYQVTDNLGELICTPHVGYRPQESVIAVQYAESWMWEGKEGRQQVVEHYKVWGKTWMIIIMEWLFSK